MRDREYDARVSGITLIDPARAASGPNAEFTVGATMITPSSVHRRWSSESATPHVSLVVSLLFVLSACNGDGLVGPARSTSSVPSRPSVVVTTSYSTFDTRAAFNAAGAIDQLNDFEELTVADILFIDPPWTTHGVTYTASGNVILSSGVSGGITSNVVSANFGEAVTGQFADADAFNLFGADLALFGDGTVSVGLEITTNLGTYSFPSIAVPMATNGRRFFGIALSNANEHLESFKFTLGGDIAALTLDNVAVGHVGVSVANADPEASVGGPYSGLEGSAVTLSMSGTDADGDALTFSWDLGDGTVGSGSTLPASHAYADNGTYDIMLAVADGKGGVDTARTTATIANVKPSLAALSIATAPFRLANNSVAVPVSGTFTDPGTLDTHTATLDCGSGAGAPFSAPNGTASGTCTYSTPGLYKIKLTVTDDDGGSDTKTATARVVVYDPASWITGGGWVSSPPGLYTVSSYITGKMSFNILARYQGEDTVPTGSFDLKMNAGRIDFHSTSFDWLVVAGGVAQLQGRGTMSGTGDYGFLVIANDGASIDAIRIRVWNRATGEIVYDNEPSEPVDSSVLMTLGGGSIQAHQH